MLDTSYYLASSRWANGVIYKLDANLIVETAAIDADIPVVRTATSATSNYFF